MRKGGTISGEASPMLLNLTSSCILPIGRTAYQVNPVSSSSIPYRAQSSWISASNPSLPRWWSSWFLIYWITSSIDSLPTENAKYSFPHPSKYAKCSLHFIHLLLLCLSDCIREDKEIDGCRSTSIWIWLAIPFIRNNLHLLFWIIPYIYMYNSFLYASGIVRLRNRVLITIWYSAQTLLIAQR